MASTLRQIARAARVSPSTASRALNGHSAISAATVDRVRRAAEKLRYSPRRGQCGASSRSLDGAKIGLMSLGMSRSLLMLPIVAGAISGAEEALTGAGASVQLAHVPDVAQPPAGLLGRSLDGVILSGAMQGDLVSRIQPELLQWLGTVPTVWIVGRPLGCRGDAVVSNDYQTGSLAAEYLVNRGHRLLACVNPRPNHLLFRRREDGFIAAAHRLGAAVKCFCAAAQSSADLPLGAPEGVETVQGLIDELLAGKRPPTAIFAVADSIATLVYRALAVRDLRVGRDISVISGNNDLALIAGLHPHLTTFDVHAHDLGRLAVRQLASRMSQPGALPDSELMVPPTLVEGQSVARVTQ